MIKFWTINISVLGGEQARGLEDTGDVNILPLKFGGGYLSVHLIIIPSSLHLDVRNYFVHIKDSLIYKL